MVLSEKQANVQFDPGSMPQPALKKMIYSIGPDRDEIAVFGVITTKIPYYHCYTLIFVNNDILYHTYGPAMLYKYTVNIENHISVTYPASIPQGWF